MNKREIYDNEISPLLSQIIAICKKNEISFVATFQMSEETEYLNPLLFTSSYLPDNSCNNILRAYSIIRGEE